MPKQRPRSGYMLVGTLKPFASRVILFFYTRTRARTRGVGRSKCVLLTLLFLLVSGVGLLQPRTAHAVTSNTINFQARLEQPSGAIVDDGNYNVEFKLYNAASGGTALWTEDYLNSATQGVRIANGYLTVNLGAITAFPGTISWDQQLYVSMNIGGTSTGSPTWDGEMSPRLKLTAVPYAFQAKSATQLQTQSGANVATLSFTTPTATDSIALPDASGTVCLDNSAACGFAAASGSTAYVQNGTSLQSNANFNIQSTATGSVTATLRALSGQTADLLRFENSTGTAALSGIDSSGQLYYQSGSFTGTIVQDTLAQNTTYHLPDPGSASDTFCLRILANCTGTGGGIAGAGTQYYLAKFDTFGGNHIGNSSLYDNGSFVGLNTTTNSGLLSIAGASTTQSSLFVQGIASATVPVAVIKGGATPGSGADLLDLQTSSGTVASFDSGGNLALGNTLTVAGAATFNGGLNVANGQQLTNAGSTLLTAVAISNLATGGNIGTAAATVDAATTFNVTQTTAGQAITLPSPTSGTAGRLVYVNNTSTNSTSFTMYNATIQPGQGRSFEWNGSAWTLVDNANAGTGLTQTGNTINSAAPTSVVNDTNVQGSIASNVLTLSWAGTLSVARGGTGTGSFTSNGVLYGNGTGTLQATSAGTSGQLLLANGSGVPTFTTVGGDTTITSAGAVTVNKLQGNTLTISSPTTGQYIRYNGSAFVNSALLAGDISGTIFTLHASSGADQNVTSGSTVNVLKGSSNNLTTTASATNTVTVDIVNNPTFSGLLTDTSNTTGLALTGAPVAGTGATSLLQLGSAISGGNSATNGGTYVGINEPSSGAGSAADFLNFQVNGTSKVKIDNTGVLTLASALSVPNGGTGATSLTTNGILFGNGTGAIQATAAAANSVLATNGSNVPALTQTLPTAVQGNITQTGALAAGSIASGFGTISTGNNITTTTQIQGGSFQNTGASFAVNSSGNVTYANGTADTNAFVCKNSSGQLAACSGGAGTAFVQGGNTFGAAGDLGTNDNFALNIRTNGTTKLTVGTNGDLTFAGGVNGSFDQGASSGTFKTGTGAVSLNGDTTVAAGKNLTLASGSGNLTQTYTSGTNNTTAATFNVTNTNTTGTATTVNAQTVGLAGTASGTNTINGLNFSNVTTIAGNTFNALNFGTGFNSLLKYNGTTLIDGSGLLQNAAIDSAQTYTNLQKVGTLSAGSITTGFGTINTNNNITTSTTVQGDIVNAVTGFRVNNSATTGNYLRGNGTNFVSSALLASDLSGTIFSLAASSGSSQTVSSGATVSILKGASNNLTTTASATDTVTVDIVSNPSFSGTVTASNSSGVALDISGTPTATATVSQLKLGNAIAGGNNTVGTGGTYIGINEPSSGAGSTADFLNFQNNNSVELKVTSAGQITAGGLTNGGTGGIITGNGSGVLSASVINRDTSSFLTGTLSVGNGGTGQASFASTNGLLFAGTTSTGALQNLANGSSGTILKSNGTGSLPSWVTATGSNTCTDCVLQDPANTAQNTITAPATAGVVALTLKGNATANADTLDIYNSAATPALEAFFDSNGSLHVGQLVQPTSANSVDLGVSGTGTFHSGYFGTSLNVGSTSLTSTNLTFSGNGTIGTAAAGTAGNLAAQPGSSNTAGGSGASLSLTGGNQTGTGSTTGGNVTVNGGTGATNGNVNLGTATTNAVSIGATGVGTTVNGSLTVTQAGTFNGNVSLANNATFNQTFSSSTSNTTAANWTVTNGNNSSTSTTVNAQTINLVGTTNGNSNANTVNAINFASVGALANNTFNGLVFGSNYNSILAVGSTSIIDGSGFLQNVGINSATTYTNLQKVGALNAGSIASGFGTISTGNNITTTATVQGANVNATTGFQIGGTATTGHYLRGNGTNYVDSALLASDLSGTIFSLAASSGSSQNVSTGQTVSILAGASANVTTTASATDTVTVDIVNNPTFSGKVTGSSGTTGLSLTGTPVAGSGATSLLQLGGAISGGNNAANGGTYIGINEPASGAGTVADFIDFQNNGAIKLTVDSTGLLNARGGFADGANTGITANCSAGQFLAAGVYTGGIVTSGTCSAASGGVTLQNAYDNSGSTNPQIQLSNANGGLKIRDAATSTIGDLLDISNSTGATHYFEVTSSQVNTSGVLNVNGTNASSIAGQLNLTHAGTGLAVTNNATVGGSLGVGSSNQFQVDASGNASTTGTLSVGGSSQFQVSNVGNLTTSGSIAQTFSSSTNNSIATNLTVTNTAAGAGAVTVTAEGIALAGHSTAGGTNTINGINFPNVTTIANNNFYGLNFGTGLNDILRYNSTQLISGSGFVQNAAIDSTVTYSNIQKVGALNAGSIASGFGTISTGNNITTTAVLQGNTLGIGSSNSQFTVDAAGNTSTIGTLDVGSSSQFHISNTGNVNTSGTLLLSGTGAVELKTSGAPAGSGSSSLVQFSNAAITGGAGGGTYIGINEPASGAGSAADYLNFQNAGTTQFEVSSAGNVSAGGAISGGTLSAGATVNAGTTYLFQGGVGTAGQYLRSNGTSGFVASTLQGSDGAGVFVRTSPTATSDNTVTALATAGVIALTLKGNVTANAKVLDIFDSAATPVEQDYFSSTGSLNVNQSILSLNSNGIDLGSSASLFRSGYFGTSVITPSVATLSAATANGVTIKPGNSTAANGTGASLSLAGGDQTGGTCISANCTGGDVTIAGGSASGGAGTRNGGNVTINAGSGATANGSITIGSTNTGGITLGASGINTTSNGNIIIAANQNFTMNSGTGLFSHTYSSGTTGTTNVQSVSATTTNSTATTTTLNGFTVNLTGNTNSNAGANTLNGISLGSVTAIANNTFNGINLGTGYTNGIVMTTVSGNLFQSTNFTVANSGIVNYVNGTADNTSFVCRNSSGQLAGCNSTGSGTAFVQGGNTFGVAGDLGTNDNFALNLRTNSTTRVVLSTSGNLTFQQASTINTSGATSLTLDTGGAAALSLGTSNASSLSVSKSGVTTTINGALTVTQTGTFNGSLTIATGNTFTNASSTLNTAVAISNLSSGGDIGTAAATVDVATSFTINQTTASQTITIPSPTVSTAGRVIYISNIGSASFTMLGSLFPSGASATLTWNGTAWKYAGSGGSAIENQNAASQTANFRISGSGQADTSFLSPALDVATAGTLSLGTSTATAINLGGTALTGNINIGQATGSNSNTINLGTTIGASGTQTINLGTSSTASSTTNITIGSTIAGTTTIQSAGGITLGANTTVSAGKLLVIGTNATDLTCTSGGVYYNTGTNRFKGCENGTWINIDNYADIQTYTSGDNTWTKVPNVSAVEVILVGGGGGGGGGGNKTGGAEKNGGGGGGGGDYATQIFAASDIPATAHASVGAAGSSGASTSTNGANGGNGGVGGNSCFSSTTTCGGTMYVEAFGGGGGAGGGGVAAGLGGGGGGGGAAAAGTNATTITGATGGNPLGAAANANAAAGSGAGGGTGTGGGAGNGNAGGNAEYGGGGGGGSAAGNSTSGSGGSSLHGAGGGGAGASLNSGNSSGPAGAGGISQAYTAGGGGAAGSGSACGAGTGLGGNGAAGSSIKAGAGGGGGAANGGGSNNGCAGGTGGAPGGGGGGGGSSASTSGAGGTGAAGEIWVISW